MVWAFKCTVIAYLPLIGADFSDVTERLSFEGAGQQCVNVIVSMDQLVESGELFIAVLMAQDRAVKLGQYYALVTIMDSDSTTEF